MGNKAREFKGLAAMKRKEVNMKQSHTCRNLLALLMVCSLLTFLLPIAQAQPPDKLAVLALLKERKFEELEQILTRYQSAYEHGTEADETVRRAFRSFANSDPTLEPLLNEWISTRPDSYSAYVSRGTYFHHLGWLTRGCRRCSQTQVEQFKGMEQWFSAATADLEKALSQNPNLTIAYRQLISMAMANGARESLIRYRDRGLAIDPASYVIRDKYLFALQPKWGGSLQEMEAFLVETRPYYAKNPSLKVLEGFPSYTRADMLKRTDREAAMQYYNQAIEQGEHWWFVSERGTRFYWMKQYPQAVADLSRALELYPQHPSLLERRGWTYYELRRVDKASADFDQAHQLDALDPNILHGRGNIFWVQGRYPQALEAYQQSLIFGKHKASLWRKVGKLQFEHFHNYREAAAAYKVAVELKPSDRETRVAYKKALERDPAARETWRDYLSAWYHRIQAKIFGSP